jgi:Cysteine rich repeat
MMDRAQLPKMSATLEREPVMSKRSLLAISAAAMLGFGGAALAQTGPVATACKDDIVKYCADKEHGRGEVRACLEANKDKVSDVCKEALDNTGPGRGWRSQDNSQGR